MTANRLELVGLSVLVLIATVTVSLAQNTGNPMLSGIPLIRCSAAIRPSCPHDPSLAFLRRFRPQGF